jgi:hypothetical protein
MDSRSESGFDTAMPGIPGIIMDVSRFAVESLFGFGTCALPRAENAAARVAQRAALLKRRRSIIIELLGQEPRRGPRLQRASPVGPTRAPVREDTELVSGYALGGGVAGGEMCETHASRAAGVTAVGCGPMKSSAMTVVGGIVVAHDVTARQHSGATGV